MSAILKQKLIDIANGFTKYGLWKGGVSKADLDAAKREVLASAEDYTEFITGYDASKGTIQPQIDTLNSNLDAFKNKTSIESYKFNTSSDVEEDSYTVQHTGWAMLCYVFNHSEYSQFGIFINGANVAGNNISNGDSKFGGSGVIPLYLQKGDVVSIAYYLTYRIYSIELRIRY